MYSCRFFQIFFTETSIHSIQKITKMRNSQMIWKMTSVQVLKKKVIELISAKVRRKRKGAQEEIN